jgi:hypothetical protein
VDVSGQTIRLHVLDEQAPVEAELRILEGYIAAMFRIPLDGEGSAP